MLKKLTIITILCLGCTTIETSDDIKRDNGVPLGTKTAPSECVCPGEEPVEEEASSLPYFNQYDNVLHPSASCQNTSIAMVLASFGWRGTPDDITHEWGKDHAQSPSGLANVFNSIAARVGINKTITPVTSGTVEELRSELMQGNPTIVHGYFTGYGHVLVATGFDGTHYTVNDPAGCWRQSFKAGYDWCPPGETGEGIRYNKEEFERAIATLDGWSPLPLWFHRIR